MRRFSVSIAALLSCAFLGLAVLPPLQAAPPEQPKPRANHLLPPGALLRLSVPRARHDHALEALAILWNGKGLAAASMQLWDLVSQWMEYPNLGERSLLGVALSPDGRLLATVGADHALRIWDAHLGRQLHRLDGPNPAPWIQPFGGGPPGAVPVAFSDDSKTVVVAWQDGLVQQWDAATGKERARFQLTNRPLPYLMVFAPGGGRLATVTIEGVIQVYDVATGKMLQEYSGFSHKLRGFPDLLVEHISFRPDGRTLLLFGQRPLRLSIPQLCLRFLEDVFGFNLPLVSVIPEEIHMPMVLAALTQEENGGVVRVVFPPGLVRSRLRDQLLPVRPGLAALLSVGSETFDPDFWTYSMTLLPDGRTVMQLSADGVTLHDRGSSRNKNHFAITGPMPDAVVFSPDGTSLVAGDLFGNVVLWDAGTGRRLAEQRAHFGAVVSAQFSADGRRLLTQGLDGTVLLWDVAALRKR